MGTSQEELLKRYGIGLTGGIACGKSTVAKILRELGFPVIDADQLAREAVESGSRGLALVVEAFGGAILTKSGALNRPLMREMIFSDQKKRETLEGILHPVIQDLLIKKLKEIGLFQHPRPWFYEASLLFETGRYKSLAAVWVVSCPASVQIQRLMKRDKCDEKQARRILDSQLPLKQKASMGDLVIDTSSPLQELEAKVRLALETIPKRDR